MGTGDNVLQAVAARSASEVWAVGYYVDSNGLNTLIQRWDGSQWQVVSSPNPGLSSALFGVAVRSDGDAWAVGHYTGYDEVTYPLILRLVNGAWQQISAIDSVPSGILNAVTTINSNDAWAVGYYTDSSQGCTLTSCALTFHWDGTQWHQIGIEPIQSSSSQTLEGVAAAGGDVWAVGRHDLVYIGPFMATLTLHWINGQWQRVSSPNIDLRGSNRLYSVALSASGEGLAIGGWAGYGVSNQWNTLALRLQSNSWSHISSSNPGNYNSLYGVAYASSNDAWAVGEQGSTVYSYQTLIEEWNGSQWSAVTSPNQPGNNALYGVAAVAADDVWAVGSYTAPSSPQRTLILHYTSGATPTPTSTPTRTNTPTRTPTPTNTPTPTSICSGYWCTNPSPNINTEANDLNGVVALADQDVWAAGSFNDQGNARSLIEHWNGQQWSVISPPTIPDIGVLKGVAASVGSSSGGPMDNVWVVGELGALYYNGNQWAQISGISNGNAVVALSTSDVWIVGSSIWHWNQGHVDSYLNLLTGDVLNGVAAVAANGAWAVGYTTNTGSRQLLVMRWTGGTSWARAVLPNPIGATEASFNGVTFTADTNQYQATKWAWAVGSYIDSGNTEHTLSEYWQSGQQVDDWRVVLCPDLSTTINRLYGAWSNAAGDWAIGTFQISSTSWKTIILHWNTTSWTIVYNPDPGVSSEFHAISGVSTSVWAVGNYNNNLMPVRTLAEDIIAPAVPLNGDPTHSYYLSAIDKDHSWSLGHAAGCRGESGIIVLDYGQPWWNGTYGTNLIATGNVFVPISDPNPNVPDITKSVEIFADAYANAINSCSQEPPSVVTLTVSINDSGDHTTLADPQHAILWRNMIHAVAGHIAPYNYMWVAAGIDAEPGYDKAYNSTKSWVDSYSNPDYDYYNFGSTDAQPGTGYGVCNPNVLPNPSPYCSAWTAEQQYIISQAVNGSHPLPEIYIARYAREWYRVSRWAVENNEGMASMGAMNNCAQANCTGGDPDHLRNPESWRVFWLKLHSDPDTYQDMPWSTDIGCSNGGAPPCPPPNH